MDLHKTLCSFVDKAMADIKMHFVEQATYHCKNIDAKCTPRIDKDNLTLIHNTPLNNTNLQTKIDSSFLIAVYKKETNDHDLRNYCITWSPYITDMHGKKATFQLSVPTVGEKILFLCENALSIIYDEKAPHWMKESNFIKYSLHAAWREIHEEKKSSNTIFSDIILDDTTSKINTILNQGIKRFAYENHEIDMEEITALNQLGEYISLMREKRNELKHLITKSIISTKESNIEKFVTTLQKSNTAYNPSVIDKSKVALIEYSLPSDRTGNSCSNRTILCYSSEHNPTKSTQQFWMPYFNHVNGVKNFLTCPYPQFDAHAIGTSLSNQLNAWYEDSFASQEKKEDNRMRHTTKVVH